MLARAVNDLEAAKARVEREAHQVYEDTRARLVTEPAIVEGAHLVRAQFERVLRGYGLERFEAAGQRFDPAVHDAISTIPVADPAADHLVLEQLKPGYRFGARLLRPAQVVEGRLPPAPVTASAAP